MLGDFVFEKGSEWVGEWMGKYVGKKRLGGVEGKTWKRRGRIGGGDEMDR